MILCPHWSSWGIFFLFLSGWDKSSGYRGKHQLKQVISISIQVDPHKLLPSQGQRGRIAINRSCWVLDGNRVVVYDLPWESHACGISVTCITFATTESTNEKLVLCRTQAQIINPLLSHSHSLLFCLFWRYEIKELWGDGDWIITQLSTLRYSQNEYVYCKAKM